MRSARFLFAIPYVLACGGPGPPRTPVTRSVEIRGMAFRPAEIRVLPGDTVEWINEDVIPHTVTAADSAWTSPRLDPGRHWRWIAGSPGSRAYLCSFHPTDARSGHR